MAAIRILVVDDDPLVRAGLNGILRSDAALEVVGEASDGDEVLAAVRALRPDVVLMDLRMARVSGIDATRQLCALPEHPHVIALTTWDVDDAVVRTIAAGASGFLVKSAAPGEIIGAIKAVVAGDAVLSPRSTRQLLDHWSRTTDDESRRAAVAGVSHLTDTERRVVRAAARGLTNAEIGRELFMADSTVKTHLSSAQAKLGAPNRTVVAVLAERAGLLRG